MNKQDFNKMKQYGHLNIAFMYNAAVIDVQKHAYAIGLRRGQENCAELVAALRECIEFAEDYGSFQSLASIEKAHAALSKFQGENHE
jgi:hypothetical protein